MNYQKYRFVWLVIYDKNERENKEQVWKTHDWRCKRNMVLLFMIIMMETEQHTHNSKVLLKVNAEESDRFV